MTSGSVSLHMPENADFVLQGNTSNGSIHCDLPLQNRKENEGTHLSGSYGNGSHPVQITASSGDITIE
jgi:lia operon protein LiaG